jgi:hypothetical protein
MLGGAIIKLGFGFLVLVQAIQETFVGRPDGILLAFVVLYTFVSGMFGAIWGAIIWRLREAIRNYFWRRYFGSRPVSSEDVEPLAASSPTAS